MLNRYANGKEYIGKHRDTKENKACLKCQIRNYEKLTRTNEDYSKLELRSRKDVLNDSK